MPDVRCGEFPSVQGLELHPMEKQVAPDYHRIQLGYRQPSGRQGAGPEDVNAIIPNDGLGMASGEACLQAGESLEDVAGESHMARYCKPATGM